MFENTILRALKQYHIHIQANYGFNNIETDNSRLMHIKSCEEYIEQGNEATSRWIKENHIVLSKAIKYAHDNIHRNYIKTDDEYSSVEHKELNQCVNIFKEFYEKLDIDSSYMDIDF